MDKREELDHFFRKKFEERTFEIQPSYWEGAEQLLDNASHPNEKKRPFIWWLLLGALILIPSAFVFHYNSIQPKSTNIVANPEPIASIVPKNTPVSNTSTALQHESNIEKKSNPIDPSKLIQPEFKIESKNIKPLNHKKQKNSTTVVNTNPIVNLSKTVFPNIKELKTPINNLPKQSNIPTKTNKPKTLLKIITPSTSILKDKQNINTSNPKKPLNKDLKPLALLPIQIIPSKVLDLNQLPVQKMTHFKKPNKLKWSVEMGVNAAFTHKLESEGAVNLYGGIGITRTISPRFGIQTGLKYYKRSQPESAINFSEKRYGFGSSTVQYRSNNTTLHFLELPLSLQYKANLRHQFNAGVYVNHLLNKTIGYNIVEENYLYQSNIIQNNTFVQIDTNSSNSSLYNRFDLGLSLGYEHLFTKKMGLGFRVNYGFKELSVQNENTLQNTFDIFLLDPNTPNQNASSKQLNLRIYFKYEL